MLILYERTTSCAKEGDNNNNTSFRKCDVNNNNNKAPKQMHSKKYIFSEISEKTYYRKKKMKMTHLLDRKNATSLSQTMNGYDSLSSYIYTFLQKEKHYKNFICPAILISVRGFFTPQNLPE